MTTATTPTDTATDFSSLEWGKVDLTDIPDVRVTPPGPKSAEYHERCTRYFKGLSGQVKLFPVTFESGEGCVLQDADGNRYIDFSSGIYVTTLGHDRSGSRHPRAPRRDREARDHVLLLRLPRQDLRQRVARATRHARHGTAAIPKRSNCSSTPAANRPGNAFKPATVRPIRASPGRSSSSGSPMRCCRCGPRSCMNSPGTSRRLGSPVA